MKKIITISALIITFSGVCMAQSKHNVTLTLHVSPYINEEEQMVYVHHTEDNEYIIDDSARIVPGKDTYLLKTYVPYEDVFKLTFSKRGPFRLNILAHPNEELELNITEEDDRLSARYKRLVKGSPENDSLVVFTETSNEFTMRKRHFEDAMAVYGIPHEKIDELEDSLVDNERKSVEFFKYTVRHSSSPYIACQLAHIFLWNMVSAEEYKNISKALYLRFTSYPPAEQAYLEIAPAPASDESKRTKAFLRKIERSRIAIKREALKSDTLKIGDQLKVTLVDSLGHTTPLSAFHGKYVLVELWASWCLPCIKAMPNILYAQRLFQKDFVCCAVTIDKSATPWKESIIRNNLHALHHYKATDNKGNLYEDMKPLASTGTIPRNILLDRNGHIIAIDIYGEQLIKKLEELTKEGVQ